MATAKTKRASIHYGTGNQTSADKQTKAAHVTTPPTADEVDNLHTNADTDTRRESLHHTLGPLPTQAAAGDHVHDGGDSSQLMTAITISGSRASDAWRLSVEQALASQGATISSTV